MCDRWKAIAFAFAFSAGLLFVADPAFAQDQQQSEQKKKEQEAAKEHQKQKQKDQQETVGTILQQQQQRPHRDLPQPSQEPQRLPEQRQRELLQQERQRQAQYDIALQNQQKVLERRAANIRQQNRSAQYRFQQQYLDRLRQQHNGLRQHRDHDDDAFFFSAPSYRYKRAGRYYDVNQYAAALLQDAVNFGYEEGFHAGAADREDGWRYECEASYVYQDANYGYEGLYVSADEYHYYFRQGFRRGYEDGYYGRHRYGIETDGTLRVMTDVLRLIIDLKVLR